MGKSVWIVVIAVLILLGIGIFWYNSQLVSPADDNSNNNLGSGDSGNSAGLDGTNLEGSEVSTHIINIQNFAFSPSELTIKVGDSVEWTNMDSASHTVTSTSGSEMDSGNLAKNEVYSHTFNSPGVYEYYCTIHPSMKGKIFVD